MKALSVTVSGSFHRHIRAIQKVVAAFRDRGVKVLSPSDPIIVDSAGSFLFVASDLHRSVKLVQDRHLAAISQSDFLWLVCPDGYVGQSASLELGYAIAHGIPIYSDVLPSDLTLLKYVKQMPDIDTIVELFSSFPATEPLSPSLLVDPYSVIETSQRKLEETRSLLIKPGITEDNVENVYANVQSVRQMLDIPAKK